MRFFEFVAKLGEPAKPCKSIEKFVKVCDALCAMWNTPPTAHNAALEDGEEVYDEND